jgi:GMP reductase
MKVVSDPFYDFDDVLILPKRSSLGSRSEVQLERTFKFVHSGREWTGIPIMVANMDTTGTFEMYRELVKHKMMTVFHKHYAVEDFPLDMDPDYYCISSGISDKDWEKTKALIARLNPHFLTIDVANGYSTKFVDFCKMVREQYPKLTIFAGNVATNDMVSELILSAKVDVVKVGIGSGSLCSTRLKTGVGVPQLSVVDMCSDAANGLSGHIISDGGIVNVGDFSKAFAGGGHFVMAGGFFAGHTESGGELVEKDGKQYKISYGMSSKLAQDKHNGGMNKYRSSEGKVRMIPYKGPVEDTVLDILGGIRSTCTYVGAKRLKDIAKCTTFIKVNRQLNTIYDKSECLV